VADFDRKAGALPGELGEEFVAAGAAEDVNAGELAVEHLFKAGKCGSVARGQALEDDAGKYRLIAGVSGTGEWPRRTSSLLMRAGMLESSIRVSASMSRRLCVLHAEAFWMRSSIFQGGLRRTRRPCIA